MPDPAADGGHGSAFAGRMRKRYRLFSAEPDARSVDEPAGEGNLRGSREGFADLLRVNISLLRRCFRNDALVIEINQADCEMKTEYALCYCRDTADPKAVQKVRQTLQRARPQLLLDSSYFVPWLFPCKIRTFAPVRYTERPIVAAAKLREGKFVILVNGSPSALILPTLSAKTLNAWMTMQERPILHPFCGC